MRFSAITAVVAGLAATSEAAACIRWKTGLAQAYTVEASGVPNRAATCGGLWDNIKRFGACASLSLTDCSGENGHLSWTFQASSGCNGGMVESAWWEATRNNFGGIDCP